MHVAPKVDVVAVDLPTMGRYFDSSGALMQGAGPRLAAALGLDSAVNHWETHSRLGQRGVVLARVDRRKHRFHLVEPRGVSLTGDARIPLGFGRVMGPLARSLARSLVSFV